MVHGKITLETEPETWVLLTLSGILVKDGIKRTVQGQRSPQLRFSVRSRKHLTRRIRKWFYSSSRYANAGRVLVCSKCLSIRPIDATLSFASRDGDRCSSSRLNRRHLPSQLNVRSTTQRFGNNTNLFASCGRRTIFAPPCYVIVFCDPVIQLVMMILTASPDNLETGLIFSY